MKADFYMDANDRIWFFYSKDIIYRDRKQSFTEEGQIKQVKQEIEEQKQKLRNQLLKTKEEQEKQNKEKEIQRLEEEQRRKVRNSLKNKQGKFQFCAVKPPTFG